MKRNSKRFLALFIAVSMSVTPTTVLHAEESSETDQIQNVEIKQDENIAQEDSETNEKSNSAEDSKEEIGKNEQAEVKDTRIMFRLKKNRCLIIQIRKMYRRMAIRILHQM